MILISLNIYISLKRISPLKIISADEIRKLMIPARKEKYENFVKDMMEKIKSVAADGFYSYMFRVEDFNDAEIDSMKTLFENSGYSVCWNPGETLFNVCWKINE